MCTVLYCIVLYCMTKNTKKVLRFGMEEPLPNPPPPTRPITSTVFSMILLSTGGWLGWHTGHRGQARTIQQLHQTGHALGTHKGWPVLVLLASLLSCRHAFQRPSLT